MSDIRDIVLHLTQSKDLTRENFDLGKKIALLNLKFEANNHILIASKSYSHDDLIKIFEYFEDSKKLEILKYLESNEVFIHFDNFYKPIDFIKKIDGFETIDQELHLRQFLTDTYSEKFYEAIFYHNKHQNLKELYILSSHLYYFTVDFNFKIIEFLKRSFSVKMEQLISNNFNTIDNASYKNHFLFHPYFIRMIGKIAQDDEEFLTHIFNVTIDFYNKNKMFEEKLILTLKEHFYINNSERVKICIKENLRNFSGFSFLKNKNSKNGYNTKKVWVTIGIISVVLIIIWIICAYNMSKINSIDV